MNEPTLRKPIGILMMLGFVAIWTFIVVAASPWIGALPWPAEALVYLIAGIVWILPLGPLLRWMETGSASR